MQTFNLGERVLTRLDFVRVSKLVHNNIPPELKECLENADLVSSTDISDDIITMNSCFIVTDSQSGEQRKLTLCYPEDVEPKRGCISVLSPAGASLFGLRLGTVATWMTPQRHYQTAMVQKIIFQPEAAGNYTL